MTDPLHMGHLVEGVVEQDPMTDRWNIRTVDAAGNPSTFDVQGALAALAGKEIRFTLVTFENLAKLAELVETQGGGQVFGIRPEDVGVSFDSSRKS